MIHIPQVTDRGKRARQTSAIAYIESPLNQAPARSADFEAGPAPGAVLAECPLTIVDGGNAKPGHLTDLLEHPLSDGILSDADRAELRGTVRLVRDGLDRVLAQRSRVTATLKEYIVSHDAARDRELEQTLRQVEAELMTWMASTGPRASHDVPLLPARAGVEHLRERFHDPADDVLPDPISTPDPSLAPPVSLEDLVAQGGPRLAALRERLDAATTSLLPLASLGALFGELEPSLRRPVRFHCSPLIRS